MKKYILPLIGLLLLILALSATVIFISERTSFFGRASGPAGGGGGVVAPENSYLFASPLSARADSQEKIRVTVFVLDNQGRGVYGQPVFLGEDSRLTVNPIQAATDSLGRAIFDLSSTQAAEYFLEARVGGTVLPQKVRISFR